MRIESFIILGLALKLLPSCSEKESEGHRNPSLDAKGLAEVEQKLTAGECDGISVPAVCTRGPKGRSTCTAKVTFQGQERVFSNVYKQTPGGCFGFQDVELYWQMCSEGVKVPYAEFKKGLTCVDEPLEASQAP